MRGEDQQQHELFGYGTLEERVPQDHPLRPIRAMVEEALKAMDGRLEEIYPEDGRKSIPPERLLRGLRLQMLYSIRSERMLMEQMEYNLLYRWFVGLSMNEANPPADSSLPSPALLTSLQKWGVENFKDTFQQPAKGRAFYYFGRGAQGLG